MKRKYLVFEKAQGNDFHCQKWLGVQNQQENTSLNEEKNQPADSDARIGRKEHSGIITAII